MNPEARPHTPRPLPRIEYLRKGELKWELSRLLVGRLEQQQWIRKTVRHEITVQLKAYKKQLKSLVKEEKAAFRYWAAAQRKA